MVNKMKSLKTIYIRNNIHFFLIFSLLLCGMNSCQVDLLEQRPVDSFNEETLFEDINLVEAFLWQCYDVMGGDREEVLGMREDLLSSSTDELLNIHRAGDIKFLKGSLSPDDMGHFGNWRYGFLTWKDMYNSIKNVNTLLSNIDNVPVSNSDEEQLLEQIKSEAIFIRAFNYTNLLRSYGGVVLVDKKFELTDDFKEQKRASLQETVDFIIKDLDQAIAGLPVKTDIAQGRATKGAAAALKSRLLNFVTGELMNGGYEASNPLVSFTDGNRTQRLEAAKAAAKAIIDQEYGSYALHGSTDEPPAVMTDELVEEYAQTYYDIFTQKGEWNDEVIWGVQYLNKQGNRVRNNLYWGPNGYNNWGNNEPFEELVRKFEMKDGSPFQWDKYNPGDDLIREFTAAEVEADPERNPYQGREPRFYAYLLYDGAPWRERAATDGKVQTSSFVNAPGAALLGKSVREKVTAIHDLEPLITGGYDTRSAANQAWNGTKTGYYLKKMMDIEINGEQNNNENSWLEFRFAEVLLDYAEACIELGEIQEGLDALNKIRNRAGLPDRMTSDQDQAREWYRHERLIEMMAEGDRWYMIRKWMICDEVVHDQYPIDIFHFNDGVSMYFLNTTIVADSRTWNNRQYWLPLSISEMNKAPQLQQNPGY